MRCLVTGAGGFIGGHLVNRLVSDGHEVRSVDIKGPGQWHQDNPGAASFTFIDCSEPGRYDSGEPTISDLLDGVDWVFNLAADMGGMGFIERNRSACAMTVLTTANVLRACVDAGVSRYFYASSACVYPAAAQDDPEVVPLAEHMAMPADPEAGYGWEKLYGELLASYFAEDHGLEVRIARYHNIYGPNGTWTGGREKAPAAACRKIAEHAKDPTLIVPVWGDGKQTRSFCWIDDCVEGTVRLMASDFDQPVNIGSDELVTIQRLHDIAAGHAGVEPSYLYDLDAPQGVRGRNSDNTLVRQVLGWEPSTPLEVGMGHLYDWVAAQVGGSTPTR